MCPRTDILTINKEETQEPIKIKINRIHILNQKRDLKYTEHVEKKDIVEWSVRTFKTALAVRVDKSNTNVTKHKPEHNNRTGDAWPLWKMNIKIHET